MQLHATDLAPAPTGLFSLRRRLLAPFRLKVTKQYLIITHRHPKYRRLASSCSLNRARLGGFGTINEGTAFSAKERKSKPLLSTLTIAVAIVAFGAGWFRGYKKPAMHMAGTCPV